MRRLYLFCMVSALVGLAGAHADDRGDCMQTTDAELAIAACTALLDGGALGKEDLARAHTFRGLARYARKEFAAALDDLSEAVGLDPTNSDPLVKRAEVRFHLSLELIATALPSRELAQRALAHSQGAEADLRKACSLAPDCTEIEAKLGRVLGTRSIIDSSGRVP